MTTDESRFKATLLYEITETKRNFVSFRFEQRPNMRNFVPFRFEQNCKTGFFVSFRFEKNWNWCNFVSFRFERSKKTCFSFRFVSNTKNLVSNNPIHKSILKKKQQQKPKHGHAQSKFICGFVWPRCYLSLGYPWQGRSLGKRG